MGRRIDQEENALDFRLVMARTKVAHGPEAWSSMKLGGGEGAGTRSQELRPKAPIGREAL